MIMMVETLAIWGLVGIAAVATLAVIWQQLRLMSEMDGDDPAYAALKSVGGLPTISLAGGWVAIAAVTGSWVPIVLACVVFVLGTYLSVRVFVAGRRIRKA